MKPLQVGYNTSHNRFLVHFSSKINTTINSSSCGLCKLSISIYIDLSQFYKCFLLFLRFTLDNFLIESIIFRSTFNRSAVIRYVSFSSLHCVFVKIFFCLLLLRSIRFRILFWKRLKKVKQANCKLVYSNKVFAAVTYRINP